MVCQGINVQDAIEDAKSMGVTDIEEVYLLTAYEDDEGNWIDLEPIYYN